VYVRSRALPDLDWSALSMDGGKLRSGASWSEKGAARPTAQPSGKPV